MQVAGASRAARAARLGVPSALHDRVRQHARDRGRRRSHFFVGGAHDPPVDGGQVVDGAAIGAERHGGQQRVHQIAESRAAGRHLGPVRPEIDDVNIERRPNASAVVGRRRRVEESNLPNITQIQI